MTQFLICKRGTGGLLFRSREGSGARGGRTRDGRALPQPGAASGAPALVGARPGRSPQARGSSGSPAAGGAAATPPGRDCVALVTLRKAGAPPRADRMDDNNLRLRQPHYFHWRESATARRTENKIGPANPSFYQLCLTEIACATPFSFKILGQERPGAAWAGPPAQSGLQGGGIEPHLEPGACLRFSLSRCPSPTLWARMLK